MWLKANLGVAGGMEEMKAILLSFYPVVHL